MHAQHHGEELLGQQELVAREQSPDVAAEQRSGRQTLQQFGLTRRIDQVGGRRTAELIPGARFELIEGMGHDYPPGLWRQWTDLVAAHVRSVA